MAGLFINTDKSASVQSLASTYHDDVPADARRTQPENWARFEDEKYAAKRIANCQKALQSLLGGSAEDQPRVALAFSGGGWRAMASGVALLDALSTPIKTKNQPNVKLLDTVSHAFGLSGGSWALLTAIAGKEQQNPFHHHKDKIKSHRNPWLYGPSNAFSTEDHQYDGLIDMVSEENVNASLERCGVRKLLSKALPIDTAVASAALVGSGTKVETWGHFLAGNLLGFLEDKDATNGSEKFKKKLSSLQQVIADGSFPLVVCSAIANLEPILPTDSQRVRAIKLEALAKERSYSWIEISPFFLRNPTTLHFTEDVDTSSVYFIKGFASEEQPDARRNDIRLHQVMAACGSAIAFETKSIAASIASPLLKLAFSAASTLVQTHLLKVEKETPIFDGTLTGISYGSHPKAIVNTCRDAGIDINVPFPSVFNQSSGRKFDIVVVMDAGAGSIGAGELKAAIERGYVTLQGELDPVTGTITKVANGMPSTDFGRERCKVYQAVDGTIIIYFLGLTQRPTSTVILDKKDLLKDVESLRKSAKALQSTFLNCLKLKAGKKSDGSSKNLISGSSGTLGGQTESSKSLFNPNPFRQPLGATDALTGSQSLNVPVSNYSASGFDDSPASPTAVERTGLPISLKKAPPMFASPEAQYFIKIWSAKGNLRFALDTFNAVDDVLDPIGECWWKEVIHAFESEAVAMLSLKGDTDAFLLKLKQINKRMMSEGVVKSETDLFQGLAEVGILQRKTESDLPLKASEINHKHLRYAPEWVDFYAVTSIARHFVPTGNLSLGRVLKGIEREGYAASSTPADMDKIFIHDFLRSRICMLLGSMVSKLKHGPSQVDLLKPVASFVIEQYLDQLAQFDLDERSSKGTVDALELMVMHMANNLRDFYCEMLTYDKGLNLNMEMDSWQQSVLVQFVNDVDVIVKAVTEKTSAYKGNIISPAKHVLLLSEAIARGSSLNTYMLLRVLVAENLGVLLATEKWKQPVKVGHLRQLLGRDGSGFSTATEHFLRIPAAVYEADGCKEQVCIELLKSCSPQFTLTLMTATTHAFPGAIKRLLMQEVHKISSASTGDNIRYICNANGVQMSTLAPYAHEPQKADLTTEQRDAILNLGKAAIDTLYNSSSTAPLGSQSVPYRRLNDSEFFYRSLFSVYDVLHWEAKIASTTIRELFKPIDASPVHKHNLEFFAMLSEADCDDQNMTILTIQKSASKEDIDQILESAKRYRRFIRINITPDTKVTGAQQREITAINDKASFRKASSSALFFCCC